MSKTQIKPNLQNFGIKLQFQKSKKKDKTKIPSQEIKQRGDKMRIKRKEGSLRRRITKNDKKDII